MPFNLLRVFLSAVCLFACLPISRAVSLSEIKFSQSGQVWPNVRGAESVLLYLDRVVYPEFEKNLSGRIAFRSDAGDKLRLVLESEKNILLTQDFEDCSGDTLDFILNLTDLIPGNYFVSAELLALDGLKGAVKRGFTLKVAEPPPQAGTIKLTAMTRTEKIPFWPMTFGLPFPWGALNEETHVCLTYASGKELPIQTEVQSRWSKQGSIRWLKITTLMPAGVNELELRYGQPRAMSVSAPLAQFDAQTCQVDTGTLKASFDQSGLRELYRGTTLVFRSDSQAGAYLTDENGTVYYGASDSEAELTLEENGAVTALLKHAGWHVAADGKRLGKFITRYQFWQDQPFFGVDHTFIITAGKDEARYADIGFNLPLDSADYAFGTPGVVVGKIREKGSFLLQESDLKYQIVEEGSFLVDGARATGWLSAGTTENRFTVAVRDFWQLYPKELEAGPQALRIHFWPAHNAVAGERETVASRLTLHQLRFVHTGQFLDFRIPAPALELFDQGDAAGDVKQARLAEPVGLARTHQMLFYPHSEMWDRALAESHNRVFQEAPTVVVDPEWTVATRVFGPMHAYAPADYPKEEKAIETTWRFFLDQQKFERDYGLFIYGNSHHWWNLAERHPQVHRLFYGTHHGFTRWPWILYARSGNRELYDFGRSHGALAADMIHCHYAPEAYRDLEWPRQLRPGALRDYKGFVPWASGGRLCYNSVADAILWHYYFTGNRRALDTALLYGEALLKDGTGGTGPHRSSIHREGSGRAVSAIELYFQTWNNDYLEFITNAMDKWRPGLRAVRPPWNGWWGFAPALERYIDLTGMPEAIDLLYDWAKYRADEALSENGLYKVRRSRFIKLQVLSYAYLLTGELRFLAAAKLWVDSKSVPPAATDDPRREKYDSELSSTDRSYFLQWMPYYLEALTQGGVE